uniref:ATPase AAA-type core domain-containing protein n=1 Tax=Trypanosoma congolense (strain IL3000) TaxID=1068625 RepID=G0UNQ3_TRYCI|nr:conserved hypothetical protein [Trypanosoma congolense IL3000]
MFPRPRFAASAVEVLRKSQKRLNDLYAELVRSFETTDDAACTSCNITGWRVVLRLEEELVRRQRSQDIEDLFAVSDRWWEESDGGETDLSGDALHSGDVKMRWAAARKRYVGQDHVWDSLTRHFLNVSIFNVEKPTVIVLFGPSGYGKSEAARLIACALHGCKPSRAETDGYLVHIHLPSFCTKDSIYSLVDPPAAHVGEGLLLSALRRNNEAVVVLDEFEKGAAEAIQHLWLSAFQKHGTLRSLKDASRTVSTDRVTFVLTCNIAAEVIQRDEGRYLGASTEEERKAIRDEWVELCRAVCRDTMHEPFVNRVDYFLPFAPYTAKEKEKFVKLQLSRIMLDQQRRGIQLCVTPNLVKVLSSQLKTFHSSHVEGKLMPLLMKVHQRKWGRAVLTSEERVCGQLYVVVPVTERCDGEETWETLHRGLASLAVYEKPKNITLMPHSEAPRTTEGAIVDPVKHTPLEATEASLMSGVGKNSDGHSSFTDRSSFKARSKSLSVDVRRVSHSKKELDCLMSLETELERKLRVDLEKAEALLVEKDLEISYLKEKVLRLEKIVAVLLANVLCFAFLLSMIVGMKTVLIISIALLVSMTLLVGMPFKLLISSLSVLYGILGPYGSAAGVGVVSVWLISTARSAAYC